MTKNTLVDKSGKPQKIISTSPKLFNQCAHSWGGFAGGRSTGCVI